MATLAVFGETAEALRADGAASLWFWQCKDPGLRLRILPRRGRRDLVAAAIVARLRSLRRDGGLERWFPSRYEPEIPALGGPVTAAAFHRHAAADARLHALAAPALHERPWSPAVLSLALLDDLFSRALPDNPEEVWDVWCHLAEMHGQLPTPAALPLHPPSLARLARCCPRDAQGDRLRRHLSGMARANAALTGALGHAWSGGRLLGGQRRFLAIVALFHWNRLRLDPAERRRLLAGMTARPTLFDRPLLLVATP